MHWSVFSNNLDFGRVGEAKPSFLGRCFPPEESQRCEDDFQEDPREGWRRQNSSAGDRTHLQGTVPAVGRTSWVCSLLPSHLHPGKALILMNTNRQSSHHRSAGNCSDRAQTLCVCVDAIRILALAGVCREVFLSRDPWVALELQENHRWSFCPSLDTRKGLSQISPLLKSQNKS